MPRTPLSHHHIEPLEPRTLFSSIEGSSGYPAPPPITGVTANGDKVLFFNDDGVHGMELWSSDGTPPGTRLVKDIRPGPERAVRNSYFDIPPSLATLNGYSYFVANDGLHGNELWRSDGSAKRTTLVKNFTRRAGDTYFTCVAPVGGALYVFLDNGQLWKSDGTTDGTTLVRDAATQVLGNSPQPVAIDNTLFYLQLASSGPAQLWKTDGTPQGTSPVPAVPVSYRTRLLAVAGSLFVLGDSGECVRIDPVTSAATQLVPPMTAPGATIVAVAEHHGNLLFSRRATDTTDPDLKQFEVWATGGSRAGTRRIFQQTAWGASTAGIWPLADTVLFSTNAGSELYRTDGTVAGTQALAISPANGFITHAATLGGKFYFHDNTNVWASDGTGPGTRPLAPLPRGGPSDSAGPLVAAHDRLFYLGSDAMRGEELWTFTPSASKKNRRVRALTPSWSLRKGRLAVDGTRWSDNIQITADPAADTLTLVWNGITALTTPLASVSSVRLSGGLGHDLLALRGSVPRATLNGDAGGDTLRGGTFGDLLLGGPDLDHADLDRRDTRDSIEQLLT